MTPEIILWLVGIGAAFCTIIAVFNYYENKQIRKRKKENDELSRKVAESLSKDNKLDVYASKIKAETVQELKDEIGEASLINEKVTVSADEKVVYETERLVKTFNVGQDHEIVIPLDVKEPEWADAIRESAQRDRVRELAQKKQGSKPFYKDDNRKDWE